VNAPVRPRIQDASCFSHSKVTENRQQGVDQATSPRDDTDARVGLAARG
jgi:hypothetical protein